MPRFRPKRSNENTQNHWKNSWIRITITRFPGSWREDLWLQRIHKWRSVYIYIYISITSKNQGERRIAQVSLIIERRPIVGSQDETDYWSSTRLCAVTQVYLSTGAEIATYSWQRGRACRRYMHTYGATTRTYLAKWAHVRFDMAPSRTLSLSALVILKGVVSRRDP